MMKKMMMTLAAVLCCSMTVSAQDVQEIRNQTYNITLDKIQYAHHGEKLSAGEAVGAVLSGVLTGQTSVEASKYEDDVKSAIMKGLSGAHRFRFNDGLLRLGDVVEDGNLIVDALITNIQAKSSSRTWKDKDGKTHVDTWYTGIVEAVLSVKDAKTGDVLANPTVRGRGDASSNFSTSDQAIKDAINRLSNSVTSWLNKYKPLQANIIQGATAKKEKQKEVYIDLGSNEGAYVGLHMGVYEVSIIAGREAKSEIGKLKIEEVQGVDISLCKVQSGGKDIKAALDAGARLRVISID
jgi:hypothetical protein